MDPRLGLTLGLLLVLSLFAFIPWAHADGQWIKYSGNPVLIPRDWDSAYIVSPRVLYDGKVYRMWFDGGNASGFSGVGYASSSDGITWTAQSGPVLTPGPSGAWDSASVASGSVLMNGTTFLMYYRGTNPTTYPNGAVGFATSNDGITWTKHSGPVLKPNLPPNLPGYDQGYISSPFVVKLELTFNMWYTARNATSTKYTNILYATSLDGINWRKWSTPVFTPSPNSNDWDSVAVYSASVAFNGTLFGMWYSGQGQTSVPQIGFATSPDGATWTRWTSNPILSPGAAAAWDSAGVEQPSVLQGGRGVMMYYDGIGSSSTGRIGMAQAPLGSQNFPIPEFPYTSLLLAATLCATIGLLRRRKN